MIKQARRREAAGVTGGTAGGDGDKKRILISGLRGEPQGAMRLASPCLAQRGMGEATMVVRGGCGLSLVTNGNICEHFSAQLLWA